jgi:hypothetical protein
LQEDYRREPRGRFRASARSSTAEPIRDWWLSHSPLHPDAGWARPALVVSYSPARFAAAAAGTRSAAA